MSMSVCCGTELPQTPFFHKMDWLVFLSIVYTFLCAIQVQLHLRADALSTPAPRPCGPALYSCALRTVPPAPHNVRAHSGGRACLCIPCEHPYRLLRESSCLLAAAPCVLTAGPSSSLLAPLASHRQAVLGAYLVDASVTAQWWIRDMWTYLQMFTYTVLNSILFAHPFYVRPVPIPPAPFVWGLHRHLLLVSRSWS